MSDSVNNLINLYKTTDGTINNKLTNVLQSSIYKKLPMSQKVELDKQLRNLTGIQRPLLFPTKKEAIELVQQMLKLRKSKNRGDNYVLGLHIFNVASIAENGAAKIGLDPEIAYVLGVLHDIGRICTRPEQVNTKGEVYCHPVIGYNFLNGQNILHDTEGKTTNLQIQLRQTGTQSNDLDLATARFSSCAFVTVSHNYQRADFSPLDFNTYETTFYDYLKRQKEDKYDFAEREFYKLFNNALKENFKINKPEEEAFQTLIHNIAKQLRLLNKHKSNKDTNAQKKAEEDFNELFTEKNIALLAQRLPQMPTNEDITSKSYKIQLKKFIQSAYNGYLRQEKKEEEKKYGDYSYKTLINNIANILKRQEIYRLNRNLEKQKEEEENFNKLFEEENIALLAQRLPQMPTNEDITSKSYKIQLKKFIQSAYNGYLKESTEATKKIKQIISKQTGKDKTALEYRPDTSSEETYTLTRDTFDDYDRLIQYADMSSQDYQILDMDKRIENNEKNYGPNSCSEAAKAILPSWFREKCQSKQGDPWKEMLQETFGITDDYRYDKISPTLRQNILLVYNCTKDKTSSQNTIKNKDTNIQSDQNIQAENINNIQPIKPIPQINNTTQENQDEGEYKITKNNNSDILQDPEELILEWVCAYRENVSKVFDKSTILQRFPPEKSIPAAAENFLSTQILNTANTNLSPKEDFYGRLYGNYNPQTQQYEGDYDPLTQKLTPESKERLSCENLSPEQKDQEIKLLLKILSFKTLEKKLNDCQYYKKTIDHNCGVETDADTPKEKEIIREKRLKFVEIVGDKKIELIPSCLLQRTFNSQVVQSVREVLTNLQNRPETSCDLKEKYEQYINILDNMSDNKLSPYKIKSLSTQKE